MEGLEFDETAFFAAVSASGARALLIGRRALIALGVPVLTADYAFWLHVDDVEKLNAALAPFGLVPSRNPEDTKRFGARPKDAEDLRLLHALRNGKES